ncbi:hypothetical protein K490DRAFT_65909 [Saccharata proteae CBS 121410]|uniref:Uncharacterized protein n=1 Tax=Saccharata proteae CBS 121410 TaxID=1314787 RepID=A0A9P4HV55_9PEZI|nr:hypothetical protein K490DRAFT_65909 [Saccharata proteae CBS 121410]
MDICVATAALQRLAIRQENAERGGRKFMQAPPPLRTSDSGRQCRPREAVEEDNILLSMIYSSVIPHGSPPDGTFEMYRKLAEEIKYSPLDEVLKDTPWRKLVPVSAVETDVSGPNTLSPSEAQADQSEGRLPTFNVMLASPLPYAAYHGSGNWMPFHTHPSQVSTELPGPGLDAEERTPKASESLAMQEAVSKMQNLTRDVTIPTTTRPEMHREIKEEAKAACGGNGKNWAKEMAKEARKNNKAEILRYQELRRKKAENARA